MSGLLVERAEGPVARAGVQPGDRILMVDGEPAVDVLDLEFAAADGVLTLEVVRDDGAGAVGRRLRLEVALRRGEGHGIGLAGGLGSPLRRCRNDCRFCFVDQVPAGLRPSLSVKDDDYRLSFLSGTFITLSNMDEADLARVERLRLSPLYVSLHDWDDGRRARLMGEATRSSRVKLARLTGAGIEVHVQIVLCPGWNDGAALEETVLALAGLPGVADVGVVPVSLRSEGDLRRVTCDDAKGVVAQIERLQAQLRPRRGHNFVHAADELYLLTGTLPPPGNARLQYENGIGIAAATIAEAAALPLPLPTQPVAFLTGTLALPVVEEISRLLNERAAGEEGRGAAGRSPEKARFRARPYPVVNRLFGEHVTVTGLLGGRDVLRALGEQPLAGGEWLLAPAAFLPLDPGTTLDEVTVAELAAGVGGRLGVGDGLAAAFAGVGRETMR